VSGRAYTRVSAINFAPVSTIIRLDFGAVLTCGILFYFSF